MTAREAFNFFRGQRKVQAKLKLLLDVGLDYLRLGQPATTLSGGEAQRLKLAAHLAAKRRGRALFVLDEPTTGLHFSDIVQLIDCFDALLDVGHSLVVVEHNLQLMKAADWIVDLGPGAADEGGQVVATGTPEDIAACEQSVTGRVLVGQFARDAALGAICPRRGGRCGVSAAGASGYAWHHARSILRTRPHLASRVYFSRSWPC
jgi:excinuclease ABC subunit A